MFLHLRLGAHGSLVVSKLKSLKYLFNGSVKSICNFFGKNVSLNFSELIYSVFCVNLL